MDVLSLLQSKNRCLQRFLALSLEFWEHWEVAEGAEIPDLSSFQRQRDAVIRALELYDRKISEVIGEMPAARRTPALIESVSQALDQKETIIRKILDVDLKIIGKIEESKNQLLKEMASSSKSMDTLRKFKSSWIAPSGEGLDKKL